jgi:hypothetical protein
LITVSRATSNYPAIGCSRLMPFAGGHAAALNQRHLFQSDCVCTLRKGRPRRSIPRMRSSSTFLRGIQRLIADKDGTVPDQSAGSDSCCHALSGNRT